MVLLLPVARLLMSLKTEQIRKLTQGDKLGLCFAYLTVGGALSPKQKPLTVISRLQGFFCRLCVRGGIQLDRPVAVLTCGWQVSRSELCLPFSWKTASDRVHSALFIFLQSNQRHTALLCMLESLFWLKPSMTTETRANKSLIRFATFSLCAWIDAH